MIPVSSTQVGSVIGRSGSKINDLQFESGARIQVSVYFDLFFFCINVHKDVIDSTNKTNYYKEKRIKHDVKMTFSPYSSSNVPQTLCINYPFLSPSFPKFFDLNKELGGERVLNFFQFFILFHT